MAELREITCEPPGENVVEVLEDLLKRARAGEFSSLSAAYVYRDGATGQEWSKAPSIGTLIGSVAVLQHRLVARLME